MKNTTKSGKCILCGATTSARRYIVCPSHWKKLVASAHDISIRSGVDKGQHSLRAKPSMGWIEEARRIVRVS